MKRKWMLGVAIVLAVAMLVSFSLIGCKTATGTTTAAETTAAATTVAKTTAAETTAAETTAAYDPSKIKTVIVMPVTGHPVHQIVQTGFLITMKELGYPSEVVGDPTGADLAVVTAAGVAAINAGARGVLLWYDASAGKTVDEFKALSPDVKVVMPHAHITKEQIPSLDANISFDQAKEGTDVAKAMGEKLKGKKGSIAITQGAFNDIENTVAESFTKTMNELYPDLKVLKAVEEGFDAAKSVAVAAGIIQANPDLLGALSTTGGGPVTWANAADQTGKKGLIIIGMDYTEANLALVQQGKIYAIVAQPLYDEAVKSAQILDKLLRGETVPFYTELDAPVVTIDGIGKYADIIAKAKEWFKK
ncbi:MAG: sugar ABC transporter substrate-binding protein [Candidatus Humimicrobiaceae bacterium]